VTDIRTTASIVVAILGLVVPIGFVALVVGAAFERRRGEALGPGWLLALALGGGLALGAMFLVLAGDLTVSWPFLAVAALLIANEWRLGRRTSAGLVLTGTALPWTILWGGYLLVLARGADFEPLPTAEAFAAGAIPTALGLVIAGRFGDGRSEIAGRPPGRSFLTITNAIREPSRVGPIGLPELAAVVALAVSGFILALLPVHLPDPAGMVLGAIVLSAIASEAYLRAMAPRTRQAMEAFVWLGSWDLAQLRAVTGEGAPTNRRAAERWLARHPAVAQDPASVRSLRVQALLLAGRVESAREAAEANVQLAAADAASTPSERFAAASEIQRVAWWSGEPASLEPMRAAATAIGPADGDDRLRADVDIALAEVRDRAVTEPVGSPQVLAPLVAMRERLGHRADGVLRRTVWRRIFAVFLVTSLVLGGVSWLVGGPPGLP
jgi:hypothetical protein